MKHTYLLVIVCLFFSCRGESSGESDQPVDQNVEATNGDSAPGTNGNGNGQPTGGSTNPDNGQDDGVHTPVIETPLPPSASDGSDNRLAEVRAEFARIEATKASGQYTTEIYEYQCSGDPMSGTIKRYSIDGEIQAIEHEYGAEHSYGQDLFYFREGKLFFSLEETGYWTMIPGTTDDGSQPGTKDEIEVYRYYYGPDETPFQTLHKQYEINSMDAEPTDPDRVPNSEVDDQSMAEQRLAQIANQNWLGPIQNLGPRICGEN